MAYRCKSKACITLNKPSRLKSEVQISVKEDFCLAEALESVYPLLDIIFSYLDFNDLQLAASVKQSWQITAQRILEKRNQISWLTGFQLKRQCLVHYSNNYFYNNAQLGIILFNYRIVSMSDSFCCHESSSTCAPQKIKFSDFLSNQVVPQGITYCVIACSGVTSCFSKDVFDTKSKIALFDACFLPSIPNVKVSMFYCNPLNMRDDYVPPNQKVKCLLLFCKSDIESNIYTILDHLVPEQEWKKCALGGGVIRRSVMYPQTSTSDRYNCRKFHNFCITFTEEEGCDSVFNAYSIVIKGKNNSTNEQIYEDELMKFKRKILIRDNSMAFRVCCSAKTKKCHESRIFNKIFPDIPLLGMYVEGEVGWNRTMSTDSDGEEAFQMKKSKKGYPSVQHQWSTVIVFITWGNVLNNK